MGKHLGEKILQQLLSTRGIYRAHYSRHTRTWLYNEGMSHRDDWGGGVLA